MIKQGLNTLSSTERRSQLRARIRRGKLTVAPGIFEMVSAKIADSMGDRKSTRLNSSHT